MKKKDSGEKQRKVGGFFKQNWKFSDMKQGQKDAVGSYLSPLCFTSLRVLQDSKKPKSWGIDITVDMNKTNLQSEKDPSKRVVLHKPA